MIFGVETMLQLKRKTFSKISATLFCTKKTSPLACFLVHITRLELARVFPIRI